MPKTTLPPRPQTASRTVRHNAVRWFDEAAVPIRRPGRIKLGLCMEQILFEGKSAYQDILVFRHAIFGKVLVLNGIVQLTEHDECIYHEMLVHPVLFAHPAPRDILVIGGGDGGVLREALRHPVHNATLVEIDPTVLEVCRTHLPAVARGAFRDPRVRVVVEDGLEFIRHAEDQYDVVIVDSTDDIGPAASLYEEAFYRKVFRSLRADGMLVAQVGPFLDFAEIIRPTAKRLQKLFPVVRPLRFTVPSYLCGDYCFIAASKQADPGEADSARVRRRYAGLQRARAFRYYSPEVHRGCTVMPPMWEF